MHNGAAGGSPGSQQQSQPQAPQALQSHPPLPTQYTATERESSRSNVGRVTPQPQTMDEDVSSDQLAQLVKDHRELSRNALDCPELSMAYNIQRTNIPRSRSIISTRRIR